MKRIEEALRAGIKHGKSIGTFIMSSLPEKYAPLTEKAFINNYIINLKAEIMQDLVNNILADGVIDSEEVVSLREAIYADGKVDKEEVKAMCELNEKATTKCPEFGELYTDVIKSFALEDDATPGVIDEEEGDFILDIVNNDGQVDDIEKAAIIAVCEAATSVESAGLVALWDSLK